MYRRNILWGAVTAFGAALAAPRAGTATEKPAPAKLKVVYHLSDLDKVSFVLGNIQNHFDGVGGPDNVTIALVIHGQALRAFHLASANPDTAKRVGQFSRAGLEFAALVHRVVWRGFFKFNRVTRTAGNLGVPTRRPKWQR